ncbi:sigma-54 interaction domain-containing protein [Botrimarina mediterranea]|uniref:Formate hydrogenlyase transcriptional activator n=1 Tax=Botrimarina mediterranea TaxID=2528022 RepID=A0A518KD44_9BACT|nr:sigma-54 dependent transcriptional regulator [Botrimarina mediterranea]QDV75721.1 Formate hydrogenlyase transcriptional activator [Botrimarina mediterranea]
MRIQDLVLQAWRETSRHNEIGPSLHAVASTLTTVAPVSRLDVVRLDREHGHAAHVATGPAGSPTGLISQAPDNLKRLIAWAEKNGVGWAAGDPNEIPRPLSPLAETLGMSPGWAGGLLHGDSIGLLLASSLDGKPFGPRHASLLSAVQEPIAVSLATDHRWHELVALREAAEADKRSLLRRLGRTDLTDLVVGEATGLAQVMRRVDLVSGSDAPVLLLGETGTGKEVIARTIHQRSDRHSGPFIRVNCGAIPPELVDSQLFGHEKGAFTGASEQRKGWFERADQGTLFLDEIGELPPDAQVRFLRVLQDSIIERVGGGDPLRVDVRVIAATHRDLAAMAQSGGFREDLWYRIAVFPILLPPLRDRVGDIPELAHHFAQRAATRFGLTPVAPTQSDLEVLAGYRWPGNIRELGAVIDRAAILGEGRTLEISAALGFSPLTSEANASSTASLQSGKPATLDDAMRRHIEVALRSTQGKIEGHDGAAAILDINPHTLRARMRKLGIRWAEFRR